MSLSMSCVEMAHPTHRMYLDGLGRRGMTWQGWQTDSGSLFKSDATSNSAAAAPDMLAALQSPGALPELRVSESPSH